MPNKDYYKTLGVEKGASQEEIKKAFRKMAHQCHPDKATGNEAKFKEINEAYQVIGNEEKRKQYDQFGASFDQQGGFGGGMNWEDFMRQARQQGGAQQGGFGGFGDNNGQGFNFDFGEGGLGDIFGDIFGFGGGSRRGKRARGGSDIEASLEITFEEAYSGVKKEVEFYKTIKCEHCSGNGAEPGTPIKDCKECGGQGQVEQLQRTILGAIRTYVVCPKCHGEGKTYKTPCKECGGEGLMKKNVRTSVDIPPGIDNNQTLRLSGDGEAGSKGGRPGDLYLHIRVKKHHGFKRKNDDVLSEVEISPAQAALGTTVDIQTMAGEGELKIPAGTPSGKVFKIKGKGMPHLQASGHGDQLVTVIVVIPKKLSAKEKKLYKELADANGETVDKSGWFGIL